MTIIVKKPIKIVDNIKVFSKIDNYIQNYNLISKKHLDQLKIGKANPFSDEHFDKKIEKQTIEILDSIFINEENSKKQIKILDAGCGLGRTLKKYTKKFSVHGADISLDYLKKARENGLNVIFSKIEDLPFAENTFDFIYTSDVLEHVVSLYKCSSSLINSLKVGGKIIVKTPYDEDLKPYIDYNEFDYVHLRSINENSLRLYYERVFGLKAKNFYFLEPYVQERSLKINLLNKELKNLIDQNSELQMLYRYLSVSSDNSKLFEDLIELSTTYPEKFNLIKNFFFKPFEFISVFEKKYNLDNKEYKPFSEKNLFSKSVKSIEEKNNTITQLEQTILDNTSTITEKNNSISQLEQTISDNQNTITEKNNTIAQLEQTILDNTSTITEKNNTIAQLEQTILDNTSKIRNLTKKNKENEENLEKYNNFNFLIKKFIKLTYKKIF